MKLLLLSILAVSFAATPAFARSAQPLNCRLMIPNDDAYPDGSKAIEQHVELAAKSNSQVQSAMIETQKAKVRVEFETVGFGPAPVYELRLTVNRGDISLRQKNGAALSLFGQGADSYYAMALSSARAKEMQVHAGLTPMGDEFGRGLYYGVVCSNLPK